MKGWRDYDAVLRECRCPSASTLGAGCPVHGVGSRKYNGPAHRIEANHWADIWRSAGGPDDGWVQGTNGHRPTE